MRLSPKVGKANFIAAVIPVVGRSVSASVRITLGQAVMNPQASRAIAAAALFSLDFLLNCEHGRRQKNATEIKSFVDIQAAHAE